MINQYAGALPPGYQPSLPSWMLGNEFSSNSNSENNNPPASGGGGFDRQHKYLTNGDDP